MKNGSGRDLSAISVLILEDEFVIAMDLEDMMEEWGCGRVTVAASCEEARAALGGRRVDLVIADFNLGRETSENLLAELARGGTHVLLLTGEALDRGALAAMGNPPVIEKPVQPALLRRTIDEALEG